MAAKTRQTLFEILVGQPGTGKTTRLVKCLGINQRNLIVPASMDDTTFNHIPKITPQLSWVTDPRDFKKARKIQKWTTPKISSFTGSRLVDLYAFDNEDAEQIWFEGMMGRGPERFTKGGLFVDDFPNYITSKGTIKSSVIGAFRNRRHRMTDIFLACHSMADISADLMKFGPVIWVHSQTVQPPKSAMDKLSAAKQNELLQIIDRVNKKAGNVRDKSNPNRFYMERFRSQ